MTHDLSHFDCLAAHIDRHSFPTRRSSDLAKREMRLRLGKVTVADVLVAQPVTTNLLKFMRASIKMIGVSNLQSFIASMTQKLTLSDISDESKKLCRLDTPIDRKSGSAGMPRPISYAVFCLKKKNIA